MRSTIDETIDVNVPVSTAYDQWTQFEEFPRFMESVKEVRQLDDARLRWTAEIGGVAETWEAEIIEQRPDDRIAWRATAGRPNSGAVTFHRLGESETRIRLHLEWEPDGLKESIGGALDIDSREVAEDLERFKKLVETSSADGADDWGAGIQS
jgi:uncharacterized membrane protein